MAPDRVQDSHPSDSEDHGEAVEEVIADYIDRLNSGTALDPKQILAEYPEFGHEVIEKLHEFLDLDQDLKNDDHPLGTLGDYTLRRQIGRGGMGVVYEACQGSLDRQVALKVLPAGIAADNKAFMRFMREARTAAQLSHQNVVSVYGMGVEQNTPYYAMEFVEGETLAQVLARIKDADEDVETPFGVKKGDQELFLRLARAFADVADGLQHAHSKGVTHRDIKPSNLILDDDGRLRILDFGLARLEGQESLTLSGDFVGTPLYMSPEQARRKKIPVDHRTDVYSLGATMYETICGRPPFRGKDHADTLSQIIERDPVEPKKVNPRVPKDLETIVLKCLRKDAGNRYGTAEALSQDLRRFVRGDPIEARPASLSSRTRRWVGRHRRTLVSLLLVVLATIASSWLASRFTGNSPVEEPNPLDVETTLDIARRVRSEGKFDEAERLVESMLQRAPDSAELRLGYAELLASDGKKDRAFHELAEAFVRSDLHGSSPVHVRLSAFLIWDTARDLSPLDTIIERSMNLDASELAPTAATALGLCWLYSPSREDPARAVELVRGAVHENASAAPHQFAALATVLRQSGRLEEAEQALRSLCERLSINGKPQRGRPPHRWTALLEDFDADYQSRWAISQSEGGSAVVRTAPSRGSDSQLHVRGTELVAKSRRQWIELVSLDSRDPVYSHGWFRVRMRSTVPGCHVSLGLRGPAANNTGYGFSIIPTYGACLIERFGPYSKLDEVKRQDLQNSFEVDWMIEAGTVGEEISVKFWCPGRENEPERPQVVTRDGWHASGEVTLRAVAWWDKSTTRIDAVFSEVLFTPFVPGF